MKKILYTSLAIVTVLLINEGLGFLGEKQRADIENRPVKYAYQICNGIMRPALLAKDLNCLKEIVKYHQDTMSDVSKYIPGCFDGIIDYGIPIYVLERPDSVTAKVGWYRTLESGIERYNSGYIYSALLHDSPLDSQR